MPPDDRERIIHMRDASREAVEFSNGRMRDDLGSDRMLALALTPRGASLDMNPAQADIGRGEDAGTFTGTAEAARHHGCT